MRRRAGAIVVVTLTAAAIAFAYVQDRVTASGASEYVMRQHEAMAGRGASVTIDQVMRPAIRRSVEQGLAWAAAALAAGFGAAAVVGRRRG
jgi:hypothetical protein